MVYEKEIVGKFVKLRSITEDDADFSYMIRSDERFSKLVGQPAESVDSQREYIKSQREKDGDYYFVVYNKEDERIGLIGVYDIHDGIGEVGREVNCGSPIESMEAEVLLQFFYRDVLKLKKTVAVIYENNKRQIALHKKMGLEPVREEIRSGIRCFYYETLTEHDHLAKTKEYLKML